ncbi:class I SAM-dependent methyltransferase [Coraliomargarita parva]|uniref:class I SAM-dependent methyltransferase n=1 Tax=Coraliomargarita parva TaxID=3014050 RepID=UPI0022B34E98|nr:class I SAM-dependent methyltransferase [Coraliomargarita parva]
MPTAEDIHAGQAVYTQGTLRLYDWFVLGLSNHWLWRCPTNKLLEFYNSQISSNHLDVGVGTGYFLDHCRFPAPRPRVALMDLNLECLTATRQRIERYAPEIHQTNVLEPIREKPRPFDSIGLNYLLHCLPGSIEEKAVAFDHLNACLAPDGHVFGSTLLHHGIPRNWAARRLMGIYNRKGIFTNTADSLDGLKAALDQRYARWSVETIGCAALFQASQSK